MLALVKYGQKPKMVELREVPVPEVRPGTVLVEVRAVGVCGWDIEMWHHRMANPVSVPVIQGHEFSGVITDKIGTGVTGWQPGDRVTGETSAKVCGICRYCQRSEYQMCPERKGYGYGVDGAFAKHVVIRQEILHRIPDNISFEEAALTEPFCVVHHALVDMVSIAPADTVVVIGPGPIGICSLQMAKVLGASRTILVGNNQSLPRMKVTLEQSWADEALSIDSHDVVAEIDRLTAGLGADVVVDAAGNSSALKTALKCVRPLGQIVKIGWGPLPFNESLDDLLRRSVKLVGTFGHRWENWRAVLTLLEKGQLLAKPMISDIFPLSQWQKAFGLAESLAAIKVLLRPE